MFFSVIKSKDSIAKIKKRASSLLSFSTAKYKAINGKEIKKPFGSFE